MLSTNSCGLSRWERRGHISPLHQLALGFKTNRKSLNWSDWKNLKNFEPWLECKSNRPGRTFQFLFDKRIVFEPHSCQPSFLSFFLRRKILNRYYLHNQERRNSFPYTERLKIDEKYLGVEIWFRKRIITIFDLFEKIFWINFGYIQLSQIEWNWCFWYFELWVYGWFDRSSSFNLW